MALRGGNFSSHMEGFKESIDSGSGGNLLPLIHKDDADDKKDRTYAFSANKNTIRRIYKLSQPEHKLLLISAIVLIVTSAVQLCIPASTGRIIDSALHPASPDQSATSSLLGGLFAVMSVAAYLTYLRTIWQSQAGQRFTARLRKQLYSSLLGQDATFFDKTKTGDILSRLASDTDFLQEAVTAQGLSLVRSVIMSLGSASLLLYTSWSLALLSMTVLPPTILVARNVGRSMKVQHKKVRELHGQATSLAEQSLTLLTTVQQYCAEMYESHNYNQAVQEAHDLAINTATLQARSSAFIELFTSGCMLCVLGYGGSLVSSGRLSPGALAGFVMYSLIMAGNISTVSNMYVELNKAIAAFDRLLEIMDRKPSIAPPLALVEQHPWVPKPPQHLPLQQESVRPMSVTFENVFFSYPTRPDAPILSDFTLAVPSGKVVALVGGSGAGKSTVAALLTRLYNPTSGCIMVDGCGDWTPQQIRQSIGVVGQEPLLHPTSIADNIRYGRLHATRDQIIEAARLAHVLEFANQMPQGLDTICGPRGTQLSGGQKQRVACARCLLKNPSILILDEATSSLDAESEHHVQRAIDTACQGRTVILIAHRLSSIRTADHIAVLREGRVAEWGSFDELVGKPNGLFRQLVGRQLVG